MVRSLADQMLYCATKLTTVANGKPIGTGTGFYFQVDLSDSGGSIIVLITNKHVVEGGKRLYFSAHVGASHKTPSGEHLECDLSLEPPSIVYHPDKDVDLCAIFVGGIISESARVGKPIFFVALTDDLIPKNEEWENFDSLEELVMIGCPRGIYDDYNKLPIMRSGHTATPLGKDYNGSSSFLMDMACFPGSSGSPVFVYNSGSYRDPKQGALVMGDRIKLVGALFQGPLIKSTGRIVFQNIPKVESEGMMHLGEVIKSSEIRNLATEVRRIANEMIDSERA